MSLNNTPSSERTHIGIFGRRNAGKSSIINAITGQNLAIVSDIKGTTTDPVLKAMELLPLGPVVLIDTPGLDDDGELGALRIEKAYQILNKTDIAVLVVNAVVGMTAEDTAILEQIQAKKIPCVVVYNKSDLLADGCAAQTEYVGADGCENVAAITPADTGEQTADRRVCSISVSTVTGEHIHELKELIAAMAPTNKNERRIVADLIHPLDMVVLVVPIDSAAPKGRLILPQQQTIRDILDSGAISVVVRETELAETLRKLSRKPELVVTDSQAFAEVSAIVPRDVPLTSFSILFARYKGDLDTVVRGAQMLDTLQDGDTVLIAEGCTHHRQCEDIGTVKLPRLIRKHTEKDIRFEFCSGTEFPSDLKRYRLIIHCGGCTLNEREMKHRQQCAKEQAVAMTNYGIAIAHMNGILERSIEPVCKYPRS